MDASPGLQPASRDPAHPPPPPARLPAPAQRSHCSDEQHSESVRAVTVPRRVAAAPPPPPPPPSLPPGMMSTPKSTGRTGSPHAQTLGTLPFSRSALFPWHRRPPPRLLPPPRRARRSTRWAPRESLRARYGWFRRGRPLHLQPQTLGHCTSHSIHSLPPPAGERVPAVDSQGRRVRARG